MLCPIAETNHDQWAPTTQDINLLTRDLRLQGLPTQWILPTLGNIPIDDYLVAGCTPNHWANIQSLAKPSPGHMPNHWETYQSLDDPVRETKFNHPDVQSYHGEIFPSVGNHITRYIPNHLMRPLIGAILYPILVLSLSAHDYVNWQLKNMWVATISPRTLC